MTLLAALGLATGASAQEVIPFDSERWTFEGSSDTFVEHLGRECLYLESGRAWLEDADLLNGVIEFDVALEPERGFVGVFWRMQDAGNYEHFYMRPHQSDKPDACQYTPVFNGVSGWQLYAGPGHTAVVDYEFDAWIPVKVEVWEGRARVSLRGAPVLHTDDLKREAAAGRVGVHVPGFAPAHFSRFRYRELAQDPFEDSPARDTVSPVGTIDSWSVSSAIPEASLIDEDWLDPTLDADLEWTTLLTEKSGLANLARVQGLTAGDTCFARVVMDMDRDQNVEFSFGFSDRVRVYLDGRLLYRGDNSYRSRDHRFLGTIGAFDHLVLPLHAGANELRLAISEDFGGWGLLGQLSPECQIRSGLPRMGD